MQASHDEQGSVGDVDEAPAHAGTLIGRRGSIEQQIGYDTAFVATLPTRGSRSRSPSVKSREGSESKGLQASTSGSEGSKSNWGGSRASSGNSSYQPLLPKS